MSNHLKSLLLAAPALLLFSLSAVSQTTGVQGVVKDENGAPVKDAVVNFDRTDIKGHYPVKTNKKGEYGHYGLPNGTYNITVVIDGKVRDTVTGFKTSFGDPKQLNFDLK